MKNIKVLIFIVFFIFSSFLAYYVVRRNSGAGECHINIARLRSIARLPLSTKVSYETGVCGNTLTISYTNNSKMKILVINVINDFIESNLSMPVSPEAYYTVLGACNGRIYLLNDSDSSLVVLNAVDGHRLQRIVGYSSYLLFSTPQYAFILAAKPAGERGCLVDLLSVDNLTKIAEVTINASSCNKIWAVWPGGRNLAITTLGKLVVVDTVTGETLFQHDLEAALSDVIVMEDRVYLLHYELVSPTSAKIVLVEYSISEEAAKRTYTLLVNGTASFLPRLPRLFIHRGYLYLYTIQPYGNDVYLKIYKLTKQGIEGVCSRALPTKTPAFMRVLMFSPMPVMPKPVDIDADGLLEAPLVILKPEGDIINNYEGTATATYTLLLVKISLNT